MGIEEPEDMDRIVPSISARISHDSERELLIVSYEGKSGGLSGLIKNTSMTGSDVPSGTVGRARIS